MVSFLDVSNLSSCREKELDTEGVLDIVGFGLHPSSDCFDFSYFVVTFDSGLFDDLNRFDSDLLVSHPVFD